MTRQRKNADYVVIERRAVNKEKGLTCDQTIRLQGGLPLEINVPALRRIGYRDRTCHCGPILARISLQQRNSEG